MPFFPYVLPNVLVKSARTCNACSYHSFGDSNESTHRLLVMNTSAQYTKNDLRYSDVRTRLFTQDAIITLRDDDYEDVVDMKNELYRNGDDAPVRIWDDSLRFDRSAMMVLDTFTKKLHYAIAGALSSPDRDKHIRQINYVLQCLFLSTQLEIDEDAKGSDDNVLFEYLTNRKIHLKEFLINKRYVVVVDYAEFNSMRRIGLVDEFQIADVYTRRSQPHDGIRIHNGVWSVLEKDLYFNSDDFKIISTVEGKVRYALATHCSYRIDEICQIMKEAYPEIREVMLPYVKGGDGEAENGWSGGRAIPKDVSLRDFILDKRYVVVADGSRHTAWKDFKDGKLFNPDAIA